MSALLPVAGNAGSLPVLEADGFSAHVDACAWGAPPPAEQGGGSGEGNRYAQLWFVSLLGSQQSVKALWAKLVQGERMVLRSPMDGGPEVVRFCVLARATQQGPVGWRLFSAGLPFAAGHHAILVPAIALYGDDRNDFLILPREADDAPALHFRFLNRRLPLPLHPSWAAWLWQRALRAGEAAALEGHGVTAYRCAPCDEALRADITAAVHRGELQLPADSGGEHDNPH